MSYDLFRWATICCCVFSIGALLALYVRLKRLILPQFAMSLLVISNILVCVGIGGYAHRRLGESPTWVLLPAFLGTMMEFVALLFLYHWYGTHAGLEHMKRMQVGKRKNDVFSRDE